VWSLVNLAGCGEGARFAVDEQGDEVWLARFSEGLERFEEAVWSEVARKGTWLEGVRAGVVAFLGFFDDEPELAHLLLCEASLKDGGEAARRRQRLAGVLTRLLDDGKPQALGELTSEPQLTAELVVGGLLSVVRRHVREGERLVELAPSLMSFVVAPYLGEAAAREELVGLSSGEQRKGELARGRLSSVRRHRGSAVGVGDERASRGDQEVPADGRVQTGGVGGPPGEGSRAPFDRNREEKE
jgi:hypothetical protein